MIVIEFHFKDFKYSFNFPNFNNIVDNLRLIFISLKNALLGVYYSFINFFKKNIRVIAIILCIIAGIIVGITFSENGLLPLLIWYHATLLGLATSGILWS